MQEGETVAERPLTDGLIDAEQRVAHTGALARVAGACAAHPRRVIVGWLSVFVLLIGLNAAFHGKLINDFKIPGSDTQKATDLITAKFGAQKGAALRVVVAAPAGRRLDGAAGEAAIQKMLAAGTGSQRSLDETKNDLADISSPLAAGSDRSSRRAAASRTSTSSTTRRASSCPAAASSSSRISCSAIAGPAGLQVRVHGRGGERPADAGQQRPDRAASPPS